MVKFRIHGVDRVIRGLAKTDDDTFDAAREGCILAANHIKKKSEEKFGVYQNTGGDPEGLGRWRKLKYETISRKLRKYNVGDKPLIASGASKDSLVVIKGGKGRLAASVGTTSKVLLYHIYGAPGAHVPMRDPLKITVVKERDECHKIIENEILKVIRRNMK